MPFEKQPALAAVEPANRDRASHHYFKLRRDLDAAIG